MTNMRIPPSYRTPLLLLPCVAALLLCACASIGRPDGGPKDITPPVFVGSDPGYGALNVSNPKIRLQFDENVKLQDVMTKVVVSPTQRNTPAVTGNGRTITVELKDTLRDSTTYTIDFTDAIQDLNEGNPLDGFSFAFSTGPTIDSLCISGMVLEARTLEPAQSITVGATRNLSDTALTKVPFERVTRTNQLGQFSLRNLAPGSYRVYAINDLNRDNMWDRSEDIAWLDSLVVPWAETVAVADTLVASNGADSIVTRYRSRMMPDDILLTWSNEGYKPQYLADNDRPDPNKITLRMGAHADSLPRLSVLLPELLKGRSLDSLAVTQSSATLDTITYWLRDSALILSDTIRLAASYRRTDSLGSIVWYADTLTMTNRRKSTPKEESKPKAKADTTETFKQPMAGVSLTTAAAILPGVPLVLRLDAPPADFDPAAVRLELAVNDTVSEPVEGFALVQPDPLDPMLWTAEVDWLPASKYVLTADSAAWHTIYGLPTQVLKSDINVPDPKEFSTLYFNLSGLPDGIPAVVELLDKSDNPVARTTVQPGASRAEFKWVKPGTYYARLVADRNANGKWDAGVVDSIHPEDTYYYPRKVALKKNWDLEQTWDINETPVELQKHKDIKKNKPKLKPGEQPDKTDDDDEDDEFGQSNPFDRSGRSGSGSGSGFGGNMRGGSGGFRNAQSGSGRF